MRISLIHGLRSYLSYPNSQTISLFLKERGKNVLAKSLLLMSMTSPVAFHATAQVSVSQILGDSGVVVPKRPAPLIWEEKEYLGAPWVSRRDGRGKDQSSFAQPKICSLPLSFFLISFLCWSELER